MAYFSCNRYLLAVLEFKRALAYIAVVKSYGHNCASNAGVTLLIDQILKRCGPDLKVTGKF